MEVIDKNSIQNCVTCQKLLNVAPVFCAGDDDLLGMVCGRCVDLVDDPVTHRKRQYAYENLAKCITYPCCNKNAGCRQILRWDHVEEHERDCLFVTVECPLYHVPSYSGKTCSWKGITKSLERHIKCCHEDCVLPSFNWTESESDRIIFIPTQQHIIVALMKYVNSEKRCFLLMINATNLESQCYRYKLKLSTDDASDSIILSKNRLQPLSQLAQNMNRIDKMLKIDLNILKMMLTNTTNINYEFKITKKSKEKIENITGDKRLALMLSSEEKNCYKGIQLDEIKYALKCEDCDEIMMTPIYVSNTGWSICGSCKSKNMPTLKCDGLRNLTLERLTNEVAYPCRNEKLGCLFQTTPGEIRDHESCCDYSEVKCLLGSARCTWKGLKGTMYDHLTIHHANQLMHVNHNYFCDMEDTRPSYRIIYNAGEFFRFSLMVDDASSKINVQHLGTIEGSPKFRYQIDIIDTSFWGLNISLSNVCQPISTDRKKAHQTALVIPREMIENCIFQSKCYLYSIGISKVSPN